MTKNIILLSITGSENLIISGDKSKILRPKGAKCGVAFRKVIKALRNRVLLN